MFPKVSFEHLDDKKNLKDIAEFYNHLPMYVSWRDLDSNIILANDKEAKAMGFYSYQDILQNPIPYESVPLYDEPLIKQFQESDEKIITSQQTARYFNRLCLPNQQWYLTLGTKMPIYTTEGKLFAIAAFKVDLTKSNLTIMNFDQIGSMIMNKTDNTAEQFHYCIEFDDKNLFLSKRQSECLFFLLRGKTSREIGLILGISKRTVETHIDYIFTKMGCHSRSELITKAVKMGLMNYIPKHMIVE